MFSVIVVVDENDAIGKDGRLLCHLPDDLKYFKRVTSGHPVMMGRKTYESLPVKPLPGRKNIIISRNIGDQPGCVVVASVEEAMRQCDPQDENFVMGGAQIYHQMIGFASKLYVTRIHHRFEADVFFPAIDHQWKMVASEYHPEDEKHPYSFSFEVYQRVLPETGT